MTTRLRLLMRWQLYGPKRSSNPKKKTMCLLRRDRPEDSVQVVQVNEYERNAGMSRPRKMQVDVQPHEQENEGRKHSCGHNAPRSSERVRYDEDHHRCS